MADVKVGGNLDHTVHALEQKLKAIYAMHRQIHNGGPYEVDTETGSITAFEPVKISINFLGEDTAYNDYAGFVFLHDVIGKDEQGQISLEDLAKDSDKNRVFDGIDSGIMKPIFTEIDFLNGSPLIEGNDSVTPASITVLPNDVVTPYIDIGVGVSPLRGRFDLLTGATNPDTISVTDKGNGQYEVVWNDGGGGKVRLKFTVERVPFYKQEYRDELQEIPSSNNPFVVQVGNAVVQISKDNYENAKLEIYALDTLKDYRIKIGNNEIELGTVEKGSNQTIDLGVIDNSVPIPIEIIAPAPEPQVTNTSLGTVVIRERGVVGYDTKTITFGDRQVTFNIPILDLAKAVTLNFGKYEKVMPNGQRLLATIPASVSVSGAGESVNKQYYELLADNIAIENPGKPVKPNKADFIDPQTGKLDKEAYSAAVARYKEALAEYKAAVKTYKAAVKAAKLVGKGQKKSLRIEQKAIKTVNKALAKLVKGERKANKYIRKAELSLEKAANYRDKAQQLRKEANEALRAKGWTIDDLNNILANKPVKSDYSSKEAYAAAKAEYKEAKAIAKLFKKADKYELKADKLESKAEIYQQKALDVTAKTVDRFKATLERLIERYSGKAESLLASGNSLVARAQELEGADMYKALGKGIYNLELSEGYARGAEIATAVLEAFVSVDVTANPGIAESLPNVDISSVNVSI